jgi:transcriptional regulator NrdR family protein
MNCKACDYPHSEVVYTRHNDNHNTNIRRRQCLRCGIRYTTSEQLHERRKPNDDRFPRETVK